VNLDCTGPHGVGLLCRFDEKGLGCATSAVHRRRPGGALAPPEHPVPEIDREIDAIGSLSRTRPSLNRPQVHSSVNGRRDRILGDLDRPRLHQRRRAP